MNTAIVISHRRLSLKNFPRIIRVSGFYKNSVYATKAYFQNL